MVIVTVFISFAITTPKKIFREEIKQTETIQQIRQPLLKDIVIVGVGDSLTEGIGDEIKNDGYLGRISDTMKEAKGVKNVTVINGAKKGNTSAQLLQYLQTNKGMREIKKASIIFFTIGGNDVMHIIKENLLHLQKNQFEQELPIFLQNYNEIFQLLRSLNKEAPIIAIGIYNPFSMFTEGANDFHPIVKKWNREMGRLVKKSNNSCFVSIDHIFDEEKSFVYHTDFFHPNSHGYNVIFEQIIMQCEKQVTFNGTIQLRR